MRILIAQINPVVGNLKENKRKILEGIHAARENGCSLAVFPELALTGYPPEDILLLPQFIDEVKKELKEIAGATQGIAAIVGLPRANAKPFGKPLLNSAAVLFEGKILGFQDKTLLPSYDVFDEMRYFDRAEERRVFLLFGKKIAITICEDIWQHAALSKDVSYPLDPVAEYANQNIDLLINLSASPFSQMKAERRIHVVQKAAKTLKVPALLCNQVGGQDSLIFDGYSVVCDAGGRLVRLGNGFQEDYMVWDSEVKADELVAAFDKTEETYKALILGLKDYFGKQGFKKAVIGLSGGIDSALVACIAVEALGKENVLGVSMPSRYSSEGSVKDAVDLAEALGIELRHVPIEEPFQSFLDILSPEFKGKEPDVTEENIQARVRGVILMALSNKLGHIVLSTGNKSELAMGYSTLYGDLCGGLSVINDLTKRQVYQISRWINRERDIIPVSSLEKAPSAELRPNQKDSDSLPDYEIIDTVLEAYVHDHQSPDLIAKNHGYPKELVCDLIRRIHRSEYKRRQSPPGLRVTDRAFSIGRRFPIVQGWV
ncbi:NAD+ synthase [Estrella lausannensis]|uniref:Glutamine-dependent NAD(+) synthetase n=1 Tax=Estrella lausannensis TaxID=483423 RepID=A0A0H5DP34_9BACT|nr:NAD+ synthase [Estrella lausannensis]CRX37658.1 Glutamine-dependent NAD(+) synthetase [Estrella lausannensis]